MSQNTDAVAATRHASLRWVGVPLLLSGLALFVAAILNLARGGSGWTAMLSVGGALLALASFGVNNDTALALASRSMEAGRRNGGTPPVSRLSPALAAELARELERDRAGVLRLQAAPRAALVIPLACIALQAVVFYRLYGGG